LRRDPRYARGEWISFTGKSILQRRRCPDGAATARSTISTFSTLRAAIPKRSSVAPSRSRWTQCSGSPSCCALKRAIDRDRTPGRFLLTGSANLLLMRQLSETQDRKNLYDTSGFPARAGGTPVQGVHMQLTDILGQIGGLQSIARELGVSESQAANGADALLPAILGGFKKQAQEQPAGLDGLGGVLGQLGGGNLLDDVLSDQPTNVDRGNDVLGQIFGSRDVSRAVAQNAASQSGLDSGLLKKMLPMVAMLVTGYVAKQRGAGDAASAAPGAGGLGGLLGSVLGGQAAGAGSPTGGAGLSGLASMLDMNGDGNPLDDIMRMVGRPTR
jgi:hypothetical protein